MNILGASILFSLIPIILFTPRRWALLAMMAGVLYLTEGQQVNIAGFNIFPTRFLELAGFVRVLARHEFSFRRLTRIDKALLSLYTFATVIFLFRSSSGRAYQIGMMVDASLSYFTFRGLLREIGDLRLFLRAFVILLVPYTFLVLMESRTGHSPFAALGNVQDVSNWMRHGRPRCFGSFRQPDLLGMCAASFLPLYIGMFCTPQERKRASLAIVLCLTIVWAANCGGAAGATGIALFGWGLWYVRTEMRKVRWGIVAMFIGLALVMKAPVWYIFDRISSITGGDGYHRSYLIDVAYHDIGKWWLVGMPISETTSWFPYALESTGAADITNQFISFGLGAGIGAIALFINLLARGFSDLGKALAIVRTEKRSDYELLLWGLGVTLVVHIMDWFGITYFDQMYMVWLMQLAAIAALSENCLANQALRSKEPVPADYDVNVIGISVEV